MNDRLNDLVNQHYGESGLMGRILRALEESGINIQDAVSRDFSPVAEFHIGGRAATVKLANFAKLQSHYCVLDLGSGLGVRLGRWRRNLAFASTALTSLANSVMLQTS